MLSGSRADVLRAATQFRQSRVPRGVPGSRPTDQRSVFERVVAPS
jgi:hypothetical protein